MAISRAKRTSEDKLKLKTKQLKNNDLLHKNGYLSSNDLEKTNENYLITLENDALLEMDKINIKTRKY
ncbi:hypothetical protein [Photobacterium profundum]|uniref:hypothetical protein n=1 Tax=Photobacterium profundum TaxID=74109 RepID=UPI0003048871|nr:hypothetical protein [Photobacterium profundum]